MTRVAQDDADVFAGVRRTQVIEGVVSVLAGIIAFVWPGTTVLAILLVVAAWSVIEGVSGADPRTPEFVEHFADQLALVARLIGLE